MNMHEALIIQLDFIKKLWMQFNCEAALWDCSDNAYYELLPLWMLVKHKLTIPVEQLTVHKDFGIRSQVANHIPMDG